MKEPIHITKQHLIMGVIGFMVVITAIPALTLPLLIITGVVLYKIYTTQGIVVEEIIMNSNTTRTMDSTSEEMKGSGSSKRGGFWRAGKVFLSIVVFLWVLFECVVIVGAGETGVVSLFGKVRDAELHSGIHLVNPLVNVEMMTIRTEQYTMSIAYDEGQVMGDDSIKSLTKEGLEVDVDFTALYRLEEQKASDIYKEVGLGYVDKLIRPEIRGVIRDVVSQYDAKELYSEKRLEASARMAALLREKLESRGLIIEEAVIRNIQLPASLAEAIQQKLAAEQEAQRYDFVLEKEKKKQREK